MANALYFTTVNGQPVELKQVRYIDRNPKYRSNSAQGFTASESGRIVRDANLMAVGTTSDGKKYEADRLIFRKANPSNHKCDARCLHAKGGNCECSCGGKNHGAGG